VISKSAILVGLYWAYVVCFVHLLGANLLYLTMFIVAAVDNMIRNREDRIEDYDTLASSRFTIPVSVIVPAYNEQSMIIPCVRSLLAQEYPEFEVIVVNDGSKDATFDILTREFELKPRQVFYRRKLSSAKIRGVYRSTREPRLIVVDKENGGKADALNCGINMSRYRYLCFVDSDTVFIRKALLKGMRLAIKDPARVLAVTSLINISTEPETACQTDSGETRLAPSPFVNFQHIDYLRSFLGNRSAWSRLNFMLCTIGVFSIWRRDVIMEMGGFSPDFTCEDIEISFRAHHRHLREKRPYQILSLPDGVGCTEGPSRIRSLISQRARWQRVINETVWHYRRMAFNPRYGTVGLIGLPYYVLYEVLAPVFEITALVSLPVAWWIGFMDWKGFFLYLGSMCFLTGSLTNAVVLVQDLGSRTYRLRDLAILMVLGTVEFLVYRPVLSFARLKGTWDFFKGEKRWHKFERNRRSGNPRLGAGARAGSGEAAA